MLAANVATPKYFSWDANKTLDVSKVSAEEINPQVYTMDTKDAVYTITGKNSNHTALWFVISEDCTVIEDTVLSVHTVLGDILFRDPPFRGQVA